MASTPVSPEYTDEFNAAARRWIELKAQRTAIDAEMKELADKITPLVPVKDSGQSGAYSAEFEALIDFKQKKSWVSPVEVIEAVGQDQWEMLARIKYEVDAVAVKKYLKGTADAKKKAIVQANIEVKDETPWFRCASTVAEA